MRKRIFSVILAVVLVVTMIPTTAMAMPLEEPAAEEGVELTQEEETEEAEAAEMTEETEAAEETEGEAAGETEETEGTTEAEDAEAAEEGTEEEVPEDEVISEDDELVTATDKKTGKLNADAKVVGSNGVQYGDVAYLSARSFNSLPKDAQEVYLQLCDTIAEAKESQVEISDIVIAVDGEKLQMHATVPAIVYGTEGMNLLPDNKAQEEGTEETELEDEEAGEEADEETGEDIKTEDEDTDEETGEDTKSEDEDTDEETGEETKTEDEETGEETKTEDEDTDEETGEETGEETDEEADPEAEEEGEDSEEAADGTDAKKKKEEANEELPEEGIIEENVALANACAIEEGVIEGEDFIEYDTLILNENFFKNQLSSEEKRIYDIGKSSLVKGKRNSFNYSTASYLGIVPFCNAVSALINTYPNSFDWRDPAGGISGYWTYYYSTRKYTYSIAISKSKYYSATLETKARKKVKAILKEADAYATANYPSDYTYGLIKYFNQWLCLNNYYNDVGTYDWKKTTSTYYYCHCSYGALLKGYAVCESYALAMNRLLDAAGIRNQYVVGTAGGGHAWNHVLMPNGKWYLMDSTWNDNRTPNSTAVGTAYLLAGKDDRTPEGKGYVSGMYFKYEALNASSYSPGDNTQLGTIALNSSQVLLKPNGTKQLSYTSGASNYYKKYKKTWSSSDSTVASVSSSGKITAKKAGTATITLTVAGQKRNCTVYVYQWTGLKFANKKNAASSTYKNADTAWNASDVQTVSITVGRKGSLTAAQLRSNLGLAAPKVTTSNKNVATATATLSGDTITLKMQPLKVGTAKITVTFAGKSAVYTLKVKQQLQSSWFDTLPYTTKEYTGAAFKPTVKPTAAIPAGAKKSYTVSYKDNKNVGTATVTIKGTGNYCGTVTRTFNITPKPIANTSKLKFASCTASKTYNGKAQKAATTVKLGKKVLKAGVDYYVLYNGSSTVPTNAGSYTVSIRLRNYSPTGAVTEKKTYTIKQRTLGGVTVTCPTTVKYKKGNPVTLPTLEPSHPNTSEVVAFSMFSRVTVLPFPV